MPLHHRFFVSLILSLGALPLALRRFVAKLVGATLGTLPMRDRKIALLQTKVFLKAPNPSVTVRKVYQNFCLTFLESLNLMPILNHDESTIRFDQWEEFRSYAADGKGVIYLTAHTGNWELLAAYMQKHGVDFHALGRQARHPATQFVLESVRARYNVRTLWRQDSAGVKEIIRALKRGGGIAALIDQDTNVSSGFANFFGSPAKTPLALLSLGQKLGCRICTLFLLREGPSHYRIVCSALDSSKDVLSILQDFNGVLENLVRLNPEQWPWFHKRWRTRPDGSTFSSKEYMRCLEQQPEIFFKSTP
ncbi:MAG: lysophospholipid acyltransferase family protein [Deltaproteobacteria bacterium]|nr:lysophospholipid acyltransferase family protein [Deltaproteobacteria bacterium]